MSDYVFTTALEFGGREFLIKVTLDGMIHWDDYMRRRKQRNEAEQNLELRTMTGDEFAQRRLGNEIDNFTVSFELPKALFVRLTKAGKRLDADKWTMADEDKLAPVLEAFFWENVNPLLSPPIERKTP